MSNSPGGKGSSSRPFSVNQKTFSANWDQIFKKDKKPQSEPCKNACPGCQCKPASIELKPHE